MGYESPVETTNLRNAEESVQIAYYGEENHSLGDSCRLVETLKLCISEEVPVRQDENYPLRPVVRLVVGDSDMNHLQTSCQNAYSCCGMGNHSPVSSLSDDVAIRHDVAIRQIAASIGQGQQSRTLV